MGGIGDYIEETANDWWNLDENGVAFELEDATVVADSPNNDTDTKNWILLGLVGLFFWFIYRRNKKKKKNTYK